MRSCEERRGFTLIEIMLVLVILVGLASLAVFTLGGRQDKANRQMTEVRIQRVMSCLTEYKLALQHYPTEDEGGLQALVTRPSFDDEKMTQKWGGPYVSKGDLKDAWGNDFKYEIAEDESGGKTPRLTSNGSDGEEGTDDDVKSWSEDEDTP